MDIMKEYRMRREMLMKTLGKGLLILPSLSVSTYSNDVEYIYRQHSNMLYYIGFPEPNTTAVIENDGENIRTHLFVPKRDPEFETWFGRRYGTEGALSTFKVELTYENTQLEEELLKLLFEHEQVFYIYGDNKEIDSLVMKSINATLASRDLVTRGPVNLINPINEIHKQRSIKTEFEIEMLKKAAKISADAHTKAMMVTKPGMFEYQIEAIINYEFRKNGSSGFAYPSICASGINATILHYIENSQEMHDGDLLLVDAGAEYKANAADITRTWPVNGKFSDAQKDIYQLVLDVQKSCIAMMKPGTKFWDIQELSARLISEGLLRLGIMEGDLDTILEETLYKRFYMHGLGHWLGKDTHDTGKLNRKVEVLYEGNYLTIEPGIYIPDEEDIPEKYRGIGVRIEDDVLITKDGCEILTKDIVKEIEEIEAIVGTAELP
ncbi:MAG: aminopeptidase P N-terminal domain-containing protein [Candidatus Heimdallarchaeota archaeon]|nr:aminopeptidase P N-terminal domain-containing protein [Candidatus Heimdallarchaeota archaeon]